MKKLIIGLGLACAGALSAQAQVGGGLEQVIVEKYYVSDAADAAAAADAGGVLPVGSVTYRIYLDMKPGYKFSAVFGNDDHYMKVKTTTKFYNHPNGGWAPNMFNKTASALGGTAILDSWLSVGAAVKGKNFGMPKSMDTDGSVVSAGSIYKNVDAAVGASSLVAADGIIATAAAPDAVTTVGLSEDELGVFGDGSMDGQGFENNNASWATLNSQAGATSDNIILIGQFTTDGVFSYQLNIQLLTGADFSIQDQYVSTNVTLKGETYYPALKGVLPAPPNAKPSVLFTTVPVASYLPGSTIGLAATATDVDGSVASVQFFNGATAIGSAITAAPYTTAFTVPSFEGTYKLYVVATDDQGATSKDSISVVVGNAAPIVTIAAPTAAVSGDVVTINASASDADGSVASLVVKLDGTVITVPYSYFAEAGVHTITAEAIDNLGKSSGITTATLTVGANQAPVVALAASKSTIVFGDAITLMATASDADGSVASVELFDNGTSIAVLTSAPYTFVYTPSTAATHTFTAKASDNKLLTTTSAIAKVIVNANTLPMVSILASKKVAEGSLLNINATITDADNDAVVVEFFDGTTSIGVVSAAPYSTSYMISGTGIHSLSAVATDARGGTTTSALYDVEVFIPSADGPYNMKDDTILCAENNFIVPIYSNEKVTNVSGYDIVINYDPAMVTPILNDTTISRIDGLSDVVVKNGLDIRNSKLIDPKAIDYAVSAIDGVLRISMFLNGTVETSFNNAVKGAELARIVFAKTGSFAATQSTNIVLKSVVESYDEALPVTAKILDSVATLRIDKNMSFVGKLVYWANSEAIKYDNANPFAYLRTDIVGTNAGSPVVNPDLFGVFTFDLNNTSSTKPSIIINRDILASTDVWPVINGNDGFYAKRILVNDPAFIPSVYQIIALDVNMDGQVTAGDVSQINSRAALATYVQFKQVWNAGTSKPSKDWLFVDTTTFPTAMYNKSKYGVTYSKYNVPHIADTIMLPVTGLVGTECTAKLSGVYAGILLGDVDKKGYDHIANDGKLKSATEDKNKAVLNLSKASVHGNYIDIPVFVSTDSSVFSFDLAFDYNGTSFKFESITTDASYRALYGDKDNRVRFISYSESGKKYDLQKAVAVIRFSFDASTLKSAQEIDGSVSSISAHINGDVIAVDMSGTVVTSVADNAIAEARVYPNPTSDKLNVEVGVLATIVLTNMYGQDVYKTTAENVIISTNEFAAGVYTLSISNGLIATTQKVTIVR